MNQSTNRVTGFAGVFGIDTACVLFFLAVEYGRTVQTFSIDGLLMGSTMLMVLALPYFLPAPHEKLLFGDWLVGRASIALIGVGMGLMFNQSLGSVLPESLWLAPLTFLILASMVSCYIQFYSLLKLRLAK